MIYIISNGCIIIILVVYVWSLHCSHSLTSATHFNGNVCRVTIIILVDFFLKVQY